MGVNEAERLTFNGNLQIGVECLLEGQALMVEDEEGDWKRIHAGHQSLCCRSADWLEVQELKDRLGFVLCCLEVLLDIVQSLSFGSHHLIDGLLALP